MSKHPIRDWLRSQFSRIEDEVQKLGPGGVFTQMRTVTQTYFEQQAEAAQPPALGDDLERGMDLGIFLAEMKSVKAEREQLKARLDEAEQLLLDAGREDWSVFAQRAEQFLLGTCVKPAGSEKAQTQDIPSRTINLSGCELTESDLLESAVRAVRGSRRNTLPRWALVRDAFCVGSGVGTALCRRFGFDPEEILKS